MNFEKVLIPVYLPSPLCSSLRKLRRRIKQVYRVSVDLFGDREIEWSFIASRLPLGPGKALDLGASFGNLSILAAQRGFEVLALDLGTEPFPWKHPKVQFLSADLLEVNLPPSSFDIVLNCSTVEHIGLPGRYSINMKETDGDLQAMHRLLRLMKASATMLLTIPCGRDASIVPWHRVYGENRLPLLLEGYRVLEEAFWVKHADNRWYPCDRASALAYEPTTHPRSAILCSYAIGCFVLVPQSLAV